jgi:hypothetical protein
MFRTFSGLWGLLVVGILLAGSWHQKPVKVIVPAEAEVSNARFMLSEIAQLSDGEEALRQRLNTIELGASPLPGQERLFTRQQLLIRLRQHQIDPAILTIEMPQTVRIVRRAQTISLDKPLSFAREQLKRFIGEAAEQWMPENKPVIPALPEGEVRFAPDGEPRVSSNSAQIGVQVWQGEKLAARVIYTFRAPERNRILLVRSGEQVSVLVMVDQVVLEATGHARSSGAEGEIINVYLPETKKTVKAKVVEKGIVEINL